MKKFLVLGMGLCLALGFTSCKSNESAYRKAYEKAKAQESATTTTTTEPSTVTPVVTTPVVTTPVTSENNDASNVSVRTEHVTLVGDGNLKDFSVVVGSFSLEANARGLQQKLANQGYNSMVVSANTAKGPMFRVIAESYADKASAAQKRDQLIGTYPGAWLLYRAN